MLNPSDIAVVRYETPEIEVIQPGRYVVCAVTGEPIPLRELKYWSVEHQEAYRGAREAAEAFIAGGAANLRR